MKLTGRWFPQIVDRDSGNLYPIYIYNKNSKMHCCIFSKLCRYVHQVMGVCCIVFDIDGMLFEFFMNFLNIEKNKILRILFFKISCFLHVSCYFQH